MVGLVIVSHSARLAEGVAELARGMAGPDVALAATGGLDLPDRPLGTDVNLVLQAIEQVYSSDGAVVLMDLGSAVLSAEMALEALPPEKRERVVLCEAPLVEGAIAAAVQARLGSSLEQVLAEARGALAAKIVHLGAPRSAQVAPPAEAAVEPALRSPRPEGVESEAEGPQPGRELLLTVRNRLGLHARPAARLVQTASRFQADIHVRNSTAQRGPVSAKSINAVVTLGVRPGHEIQLRATGPDAEAALAALQALAEANFGDETDERPTSLIPSTSLRTSPHPLSRRLSCGLPYRPLLPIRITLPTSTKPRRCRSTTFWSTRISIGDRASSSCARISMRMRSIA